MIKNIKKLKNLGIFKDYQNNGVEDFKKYNLFFGYNASGKSTLSHLFRCMENRAIPKKYSSSEASEFYIGYDGSKSPITQNNITEIDKEELNVRVFNKEFTDENISWDEHIKSILLIDKNRISDTEKLSQLKKVRDDDIETHQRNGREISGLSKALSQFATDSARSIKRNFQVIDTSDNRYINYNKLKWENFIKDNHDGIELKQGWLDEQQVVKLTKEAKPNEKPGISFNQQEYLNVNRDTFIQIKKHLDNLLKESVISKTITRLSENSDIQSWVEAGLHIHKKHKVNQCEFCRNEITEERKKELEEHFNDAYKAFQKRLKDGLQLFTNLCPQSQLPDTTAFYDELQSEYAEEFDKLEKNKERIDSDINVWQDTLKKKIDNPFQTDLVVAPIPEQVIENFSSAITTIHQLVETHNDKTNNFRAVTNNAKKKLELHYATEQIWNFNYFQKKQEVMSKESEQTKINARIKTKNDEIMVLENSLSDEGIGAEQFNESLHKFIGHSELTLRFNSDKNGYDILRNDVILDTNDSNLSEGEKTAIAFVYFIIKLKENDNKIEDSIIVVDDPVSSFDSHHLLHAYSYIRKYCGNAKQLFVLTHDLMFFRLTRDWLYRKNPHKEKVSNFYVVETDNKESRNAKFINAPNALTNYDTEYHYIFSKLYIQKDENTFDIGECYQVANLSRKLLEAFLKFKFPTKRSFYDLLDVASKKCKNFDDVRKNKIYKFLQQYSHLESPEISGDTTENLIGERINIISDVFELIRELDDKHYNEMIQIANGDREKRTDQPPQRKSLKRTDRTGHG